MGQANGSSVSGTARTINIAVRTAHISVMALLVGGRFFGADHASMRLWHILTILTGVALLVSEASHSRHWAYQTRGIVVFAHVGAFALIAAAPGLARPALVTAMVLGSVGSHLPKAIRKWSFRHRTVMGDGDGVTRQRTGARSRS